MQALQVKILEFLLYSVCECVVHRYDLQWFTMIFFDFMKWPVGILTNTH